MNWYLPSFLANLFGTIILVLVYTYLYTVYKKKYLLIWSVAWLFYSLRLVSEIINLFVSSAYLNLAAQSFTLISGFFLIWGTYRFTEKRLHPFWFAASSMGLLWMLVLTFLEAPFLFITIPPFVLLSAIFIWTGIAILIRGDKKSSIIKLTAICFILWGIHKLDFPFLRPVEWLAPWGFLLSAFLEFTIAFSFMLIFFEDLQKRLMAKERSYRTIFNAAQEAIFIHRTSSPKIIDCNQRVADLFGYLPEEIVGMEIGQLSEGVAPFRAEDVQERVKNDVTVVDPQPFEWKFKKKNGSVFWGEVSITKTSLDGEEKILAVVRDMSLRKQTEDKIKKANFDLEKASNAKSEFLANMSHELRTPMNAILGMSELLAETSLKPEQQSLLKSIRRAGTSLMELISNILDMSQIESGNIKLEYLPFNLKEILDTSWDIFKLGALEKNLEFILDFPDSIPTQLQGDPYRLKQILINFLSNAVKFTNQGRIALIVKMNKNSQNKVSLTFSVFDTGIGIHPDNIPHIFLRFTQLDSSKTKRYAGTGLGLSIAKQLIERMGGTIEVQSQIDQGSCFHFKLEFDLCAAAESSSTSPSTNDEIDTRPLRILLAEDSIENQNLISFYLKKTPYQLDIVSDGLEAVKQVEQFNYDLILMDIQMPILDGLSATQRIREREIRLNLSPLPILALSAYVLDEEKQKSLNAGCNAHLTKPIKKADLLKAIIQETRS